MTKVINKVYEIRFIRGAQISPIAKKELQQKKRKKEKREVICKLKKRSFL